MKLKSKLKLYEEFAMNLANESVNDSKPMTDVKIDQTSAQPTQAEIIRTEVIRDVDTILNNLIELSGRVEESNTDKIEDLLEELFDVTMIDDLNEGILDFIKSPIKFTKIQMNMKKYQKALVQQAINDVDFAKKKEASDMNTDDKAADEATKKKLEVLKQANLAKNKALKDQADAISDRMAELAKGDEGLGKVVSLGKAKSKLTAAKTVMKATSGEEAKQLKLEVDTLEDRIASDEKSLKDYAKAQSEEPNSQLGNGEEETTTKKPKETEEETTTKKPEETEETEETTTKKPEETEETTTKKPEETEETTTKAPEETTTKKPEETEETTTKAPEETTTKAPEETTTKAPEKDNQSYSNDSVSAKFSALMEKMNR